VSRGYTGNPRPLRPPRLRAGDLAWIAGCVVAAVIVVGVDRVVA
jgi:hypothetical protein